MSFRRSPVPSYLGYAAPQHVTLELGWATRIQCHVADEHCSMHCGVLDSAGGSDSIVHEFDNGY